MTAAARASRILFVVGVAGFWVFALVGAQRAPGYAPATDYLSALSGLFGARLGLGEARRAVVLASARLARAQGRLDLEWTRTQLEDVR